jgi:hypothetical protein
VLDVQPGHWSISVEGARFLEPLDPLCPFPFPGRHRSAAKELTHLEVLTSGAKAQRIANWERAFGLGIDVHVRGLTLALRPLTRVL